MSRYNIFLDSYWKLSIYTIKIENNIKLFSLRSGPPYPSHQTHRPICWGQGRWERMETRKNKNSMSGAFLTKTNYFSHRVLTLPAHCTRWFVLHSLGRRAPPTSPLGLRSKKPAFPFSSGSTGHLPPEAPLLHHRGGRGLRPRSPRSASRRLRLPSLEPSVYSGLLLRASRTRSLVLARLAHSHVLRVGCRWACSSATACSQPIPAAATCGTRTSCSTECRARTLSHGTRSSQVTPARARGLSWNTAAGRGFVEPAAVMQNLLNMVLSIWERIFS